MVALLGQSHKRITGFFAWWGGELTGLVPMGLRGRILSRPDGMVLARLGDGALTLSHPPAGGDERQETVIDLANKDAQGIRNAVGATMGKSGSRRLDLVLRMAADRALYRTLDMPLGAEAELRQALALQIDRLTPFSRDEVCFDYRITERPVDAPRLSVELIVVPRAAVESAVETAEHWGLQPTIVDVTGPDPSAEPVFNLLTDIRPAAETRSVSRFNIALAVLAVVLAAAAVYVPLERKKTALKVLRDRVDMARIDAEAAARMRGEAERLLGDSRFLLERKRKATPVLGVVNELTRVLPDHTWVSEMVLSGKTLRISGYSAAASSLIGLTDQSRLLQNPGFRSPVTQDPKTNLERFSLSLEVAEPGAAKTGGTN